MAPYEVCLLVVMIFSIKPLIAGVAQRSRRYCDGHHKMSDLGAAGELVHRGGERLRQNGRTSDWMVHAGSNGEDHEHFDLGCAKQDRELLQLERRSVIRPLSLSET